MIGQLVGSYRVVRALGEGGMGVVYLAEHTAQRRFAAIKLLAAGLSDRPELVHRFFDDARAATALADPGIVQVYEAGFRADGAAYLVMEALVGEPLDRRLRRFGRVPASTALRVVRQLAITLRAAHAAGIVHGDVKPENVFLVADPSVPGGERAKVLDFGVARLIDALGTPHYLSPEQCRGTVDVDARADVYALGCVLYHLLVGRPPFVAEAHDVVAAMHLHEAVTPPSAVLPVLGDALDPLVMRCLAKAPGERYAGMDDVVAEIDRRLLAVAEAEAAIALGSSDNHDLASVSARWLTPAAAPTASPRPRRPILWWWRRRRGLDDGVPG